MLDDEAERIERAKVVEPKHEYAGFVMFDAANSGLFGLSYADPFVLKILATLESRGYRVVTFIQPGGIVCRKKTDV